VIPPVAIAALALALAVHLELLTRLRAVDERDPPWWLGYARDGTNLSAALMLWGAYWMARFAPAVALCAAMLTTLGSYLLDWALARVLRLRHVRLALTVPFAAWVAFVAWWPHMLSGALGGLILAVQPQ
jgi:hypothetical protein